jgi:hypothetical protein
MNKEDFLKLVGAAEKTDAEYLPIACLLRCGYGVAGYFNASLNNSFTDITVLLNARLVNLNGVSTNEATVRGFNDFLEEIAQRLYSEENTAGYHDDVSGKSVPMCAVPLNEISVIYPIAQIGKLMRAARQETAQSDSAVPAFLDFDNRSIILKILRSKLW